MNNKDLYYKILYLRSLSDLDLEESVGVSDIGNTISFFSGNKNKGINICDFISKYNEMGYKVAIVSSRNVVKNYDISPEMYANVMVKNLSNNSPIVFPDTLSDFRLVVYKDEAQLNKELKNEK